MKNLFCAWILVVLEERRFWEFVACSNVGYLDVPRTPGSLEATQLAVVDLDILFITKRPYVFERSFAFPGHRKAFQACDGAFFDIGLHERFEVGHGFTFS